MSYFRDSNLKEIDVFVEEGGRIRPLEIKKSANPDRREIKKFDVLDKTNIERMGRYHLHVHRSHSD